MFIICPTCKTKYKVKDEFSISSKQKVLCLNCKQNWVIYKNIEEYFSHYFIKKTDDDFKDLNLKSKNSKFEINKELEALIKEEIKTYQMNDNHDQEKNLDKPTLAGFISVSIIFILGIIIYEYKNVAKKNFFRNSDNFDLYISFIDMIKKYILNFF